MQTTTRYAVLVLVVVVLALVTETVIAVSLRPVKRRQETRVKHRYVGCEKDCAEANPDAPKGESWKCIFPCMSPECWEEVFVWDATEPEKDRETTLEFYECCRQEVLKQKQQEKQKEQEQQATGKKVRQIDEKHVEIIDEKENAITHEIIV